MDASCQSGEYNILYQIVKNHRKDPGESLVQSGEMVFGSYAVQNEFDLDYPACYESKQNGEITEEQEKGSLRMRLTK